LQQETVRRIHPIFFRMELSRKALFFGTGLVTRTSCSAGLPWEALSLPLASWILQEELGFGTVIHGIGDHLAIEGEPRAYTTPEQIYALRAQHREIVQRTAKLFGRRVRSLYASELIETPEYTVVQRELLDRPLLDGANFGRYGRLHDLFIITCMRRFDVVMKLGWTERVVAGNNRRFCTYKFDEAVMAHEEAAGLSFGYLPGGRSTSTARPRSVLYAVHTEDVTKRILLHNDAETESFVRGLWSRLVERSELPGPKNAQARRIARNILEDLRLPLTLAERLGWKPSATSPPDQILELLGAIHSASA